MARQHKSPDTDDNYSIEPAGERTPRISVMDWLLAVSHVAARRLRGVPRAPMIALHPRQ
jgi:hypothetical protein